MTHSNHKFMCVPFKIKQLKKLWEACEIKIN